MIIYKATNLINNKVYIGQTKRTLHARIKCHYKKSKFKNTYFGSAINKYGINNFKWEIIELCDSVDKLNEREKYWISYYNSTNTEIGYNMTKGGAANYKKQNNKNREYPFKKGNIPHNKGLKGYFKATEETKNKQRNSSPKNKTIYLCFEGFKIAKFQSVRDCSRILEKISFNTIINSAKNNIKLKKGVFKNYNFSYD